MLRRVRLCCILSPFPLPHPHRNCLKRWTTPVLESSGARRGCLTWTADYISAFSHTLAGIQNITINTEPFGAKIGFRINCEKTKDMKIGPEQHPPMLIMQQNVAYVETFLGRYMSSNRDSEPDVRARIGKDASIVQRLRPIWS